MPEQMTTEDLHKDPMARGCVASHVECWDEYQIVLQFLRNFGKEHAPTARLILLTMIGHEADAYQISYDRPNAKELNSHASAG